MVLKKQAAKKAVKKTAKRATQRTPLSRVSMLPPVWSTGCPDWERRIVERETLTPCEPLFPTAVEVGMQVFDSIQLVESGITMGDCLPWVREFAAAVFGSYCDVEHHPLAGRRMIRTFFMLVAKKNGKSAIAAGIMLAALILNWRPEAEFLILAPTKIAADNCFKPIRAAILADERMDYENGGILKINMHQREITDMRNNATLKVVAADSASVVGKKATGVLVDELHEFGKVAKAEDMLVEATGGLMSRPEGFVIYISTQSAEPPAGVFKAKLEYARAVRDGKVIDPSFYPIIYEYPDYLLRQKAFLDEKYWYVPNPNIGLSVDEEALRIKFNEAQHTGEDTLQGVLSKHFNVQIGIDLGGNAWPAVEFWPETTSNRLKLLDDLLNLSEVVTIGIDGGGLDDLLALTVCGRERGTGKLLLWSHLWVHKLVLRNRKEIAPRLEDFKRAGELSIVEHLGEDTQQLCDMILKIDKSELLAGIGLDPARIQSLKKALDDAGIDTQNKDFFQLVRQGWSLYGAILYSERMLGTPGAVEHADQAIMNWCMGNAQCVLRGNALLLSKEISGKAKIDGVMSMLNAMHLMSYNPPAKQVGWDLSIMGVI